MNWRAHLQTRLLEIQPASVYALDESARHLAVSVLAATPVNMPEKPPDSPCALALGVDVLGGLNQAQAQHVIHQARLYAAPRILVAVRSDCALDDAAFRALGFTLSTVDSEEAMRVYHYDLDTYKSVPDWLNARYWAHPERWEP